MILLQRKFVAIGLVCFLFALFFLPFQVESIHSTVYTGPGFRQIRPNPEVNYYNAYHENYVIWLHGFFFLSALLLFVARKRIHLLFSVIAAGLNLICYIVIHEGLLFSFDFFGPKYTLEIGFGYYATLILSAFLFLYGLAEFTKFPLVRKYSNPHLIDESFELIQDNK
jgi:hypothetical protein